jgi:hypothetical protein
MTTPPGEGEDPAAQDEQPGFGQRTMNRVKAFGSALHHYTVRADNDDPADDAHPQQGLRLPGR